MNSDGTYDLLFDDGERAFGVSAYFVREIVSIRDDYSSTRLDSSCDRRFDDNFSYAPELFDRVGKGARVVSSWVHSLSVKGVLPHAVSAPCFDDPFRLLDPDADIIQPVATSHSGFDPLTGEWRDGGDVQEDLMQPSASLCAQKVLCLFYFCLFFNQELGKEMRALRSLLTTPHPTTNFSTFLFLRWTALHCLLLGPCDRHC